MSNMLGASKKSRKGFVLRCAALTAGLMCNSFGVSLITKSAMGSPQVSSIPYVLSLYFTRLSFGAWTLIFNVLLVLMQIPLLRRDFRPVQLLQLVASLLFSVFIDGSMAILSGFAPESLVARLLSLVIGCCVLAFGINLEVAPRLITVPGEGIVNALTQVTGRRFGSVKMAFDVSLIVLAAICSMVLFGRLNGVGFGTLVSALLVGRVVNLISAHVPLIRRIREL